MTKVSFKERVINEAIRSAHTYKQIYVDYEYLICSDAFSVKDYYIIDAKPDNYQHLIGVNSLISPKEFYDKCCDGTLQETDFNFIKNGQSEKSVIGSVRRKISVLSDMMNIFQNDILAEEDFIKNKIFCSIATANNRCTLGFIETSKSRPKSLLKGNELDKDKAKAVNLILKKHIRKEKFDEIIKGNSEMIAKYLEAIKNCIDDCLIPNNIDILKEESHKIFQQVSTETILKQIPKEQTGTED